MPCFHRALSPIFEGIVFTFEFSGRPVRGLVTSNALESAFGAMHHPGAWVRCFDEHEEAIVEAARSILQRHPLADPVLVRALENAPLERS
jgi:hypothetical protein